MNTFSPDYSYIERAARNKIPSRLPLYEHLISERHMEEILGSSFSELLDGDKNDIKEYFRNYCNFFYKTGYDTVSFECCISQAMPGSGSLGGHKQGVIRSRDDFNRYPWTDIKEIYFKKFAARFECLREALPEGMKAVGGPGNGVFECVQDIVGYMDLCYIKADDPELYSDLFIKTGDVCLEIWKEFLERFNDIYCVMRFGDDLGFKTNTLLPEDDIKENIIPQYKKIIDLVHSYNKPFLLHSCGNIFSIMDDLISVAGIDSKHSNEDQIAPFHIWVAKYGDKIGNFGGIDTDAVCQLSYQPLREYIHDVIAQCQGKGGFAFGTGNSIPDYVPVENYMNMIDIVREYRGDHYSRYT